MGHVHRSGRQGSQITQKPRKNIYTLKLLFLSFLRSTSKLFNVPVKPLNTKYSLMSESKEFATSAMIYVLCGQVVLYRFQKKSKAPKSKGPSCQLGQLFVIVLACITATNMIWLCRLNFRSAIYLKMKNRATHTRLPI